MLQKKQYDVVIIGGGPAGYVTAIRASQLGKKCALVEKRATLGGTCLNLGCIPTKALLDSTHKYADAQKNFSAHGLAVSSLNFDLPQMMRRKQEVVTEICSGVDFLMKKNKVDVFHAHASFLSAQQIQLVEENGNRTTLGAQKFVIATGSQPIGKGKNFAHAMVDEEDILTSDAGISLTQVPRRLAIIGAGVIGLELGAVWSRLGAQVEIIEMLDRLLPPLDKQVSVFYERSLKAQGFNFFYSHSLSQIEKQNGEILLTGKNLKTQNDVHWQADKVLIAVGRSAYTQGLNLENANIEIDENGKIPVGQNFQTNVANIYAIGDVTPGLMLAHRAMHEGERLGEILADANITSISLSPIPSVIYTSPELAWIGKSEEDLKLAGVDYVAGKSYVRANARAHAMQESEGLVKILAEKKSGKIISAFLLAPHASEFIGSMALAIKQHLTLQELAQVIEPHPTISELIKEAVLAALEKPLHG